VILRAGSIPWLLAHEVRLARRGLTARPGMKWRAPLVLVAVVVAGLLVGVPAGLAIRRFGFEPTPLIAAIAALGVFAVFTLMLSQSLAAATETLYARGDLDLLFASPVRPRAVLFAKCAGIAANAFLGFALLITPFIWPVALIARPAWLAIYLVLAALALIATATGLLIAIVLFRVIGPKRTRVVSQLLAVLIGAGVFLVAQSRNLLGQSRFDAWLGTVSGYGRHAGGGPLSWPLRAIDGDIAVVGPLVVLAIVLFWLATQWIGRRFAKDAASASGAAVSGRQRGGEGAFTAGVFRVTVRKELRLLGRDTPLLAQVLLRVVYLLPMLFILLRNAGGHGASRLSGAVGAVVFLSGQVAGSLVWLTVAAEDAPELIGCAPASVAEIRRAKLSAALAPLAAILSIPLVVLVVLSPRAGLAATVGCVASALAGALIGFTLQKPAKRSMFNRRGAGSLSAILAEFASSAIIAATAGVAVVWPPLVVAPCLVAALAGWALWRNNVPSPFPLPKPRVVVQ